MNRRAIWVASLVALTCAGAVAAQLRQVTGYVELATARAADDIDTAIGQKYAESVGATWPMPPDVVGPGAFPCGLSAPTPFAQLTPEQQALVSRQPYYTRALRHDDGVGGVLVVDEVIDALPVAVTKRTREQLTARNRTLVDERVAVEAGARAMRDAARLR